MCVDELDDLLHTSIKARLMSDVPLGVFLSGGLDSSLIAAIAKQHKPDLKTFSIHFNEASFDESIFSKQASDYLETTHYSELFSFHTFQTHFDNLFSTMNEPFADPSFFPTTYLSQLSKKHVTVALGGDGSDELFAGYPTALAHKMYRWIPFLNTSLLKRIFPLIRSSSTNFSFKFKLAQFLKGQGFSTPIRHMYWMSACTNEQKKRVLKNPMPHAKELESYFEACFERYKATDKLNRILYLDLKSYLVNDILFKTDQASMSQSLEVRVPFLDHHIVEWAFTMPSHLKLRGMMSKYILKKLGKRYLPKAIIHRRKKGFGIPLLEWMKGPFKQEIKDELLHHGRSPMLNNLYLNDISKQLDSGSYVDCKMIWSLFILKKWCRENKYAAS
jgi:asparagine synthase (glutamine-hydrolysing)